MSLILACDSVALGFSLANFFANGSKDVIINRLDQYGGYVAAKAVGNVITPEVLLPIFVKSKVAFDLLQHSSSLPGQPEGVATVTLVFSTAGLITKTGDVPTNATMKAVIAAFVEYMSSVTNSGNIPFAYIRMRRLNLTFKQHIQMQLILFGLLVSVTGCCIVVVCFTKRFIKRSRLFFKKSVNTIQIIKKFRLTRLRNSNLRLVKVVKLGN